MKKAQKTGESILIEGCRSVCVWERQGKRACVCVQMRKQLVWGKEIINRIFLFLMDTMVKLFSLGPWARLNIFSAFP